MNDDGAYEVGFGKPPRRTQFAKGKSGNPRGRPKGALNVATMLERILEEKVIITLNGRRRTVTKLQAAITQLTDKAAGGDLKALQLLTSLLRSTEERRPSCRRILLVMIWIKLFPDLSESWLSTGGV
jgi:hypothetical protein